MARKLSAFDEAKLAELKKKADEGSVMAMNILQRETRDAYLEEVKEDITGRALFDKPEDNKDVVREAGVMPSIRDFPNIVDELDISEIERYIQSGKFSVLPEHMAVYLKWMEIAHDWYYKFKSRNWVIRYLVANCKDSDGNSISHYMAEKIFNDMMSFFYADKNFKKHSWLRYLAERIEMGAAMALADNDFDTYGKNLERAAKIIASIPTEQAETDPRLLDRRPRFFITNAKELGVPEVDRYELARQIDEMDLTEKEKISAKRDLGVEERDIT